MLKKILFLLFPIISFSQNVILSDNAKVSILTCGTAPVSYAMYGHTGIRITDFVNQIDVVYNYGAFDFTTPNFMMKFVKGDLQYFVTSDNYYDFEYNYKLDGRSIVEQELNLSPQQKQQLLNELNNSLTSDERFYTYKFIDKNCTTMVVDKINKILGSEVLQQPKSEQSYREILYPYMSDFYMKLGIQIIFGAKVDQPATRLFLPLELEKVLETATLNGQKIAQPTKILNKETVSTPFSWVNSIYSLLAAILILILLNKKSIQITYFIFAGLLGLFFSLVGLYSLHEEILWNYNILLFNPLLLVFAYFYWKNNTPKIILLGQICFAFTLIYLMYIVSKVQLLIVLPIVALHLFWLIRIVIGEKQKLKLNIMKRFFLLASIILFSFGFTIQTKNDPKLIGTWKGSEKNNQIEGVTKSWIMKRKSNGTYIIEFTAINKDNQKETFKEKGKWWTSGNQLFEQYEGSDKPAVYTYKILDDKTIYFKMTSSDTEFNNNNYEFIDTKIE